MKKYKYILIIFLYSIIGNSCYAQRDSVRYFPKLLNRLSFSCGAKIFNPYENGISFSPGIKFILFDYIGLAPLLGVHFSISKKFELEYRKAIWIKSLSNFSDFAVDRVANWDYLTGYFIFPLLKTKAKVGIGHYWETKSSIGNQIFPNATTKLSGVSLSFSIQFNKMSIEFRKDITYTPIFAVFDYPLYSLTFIYNFKAK